MAKRGNREIKVKWEAPPWLKLVGRILVLIITIAMVIGAILLVVNRDRWNMDAVKRYVNYQILSREDSDAAQFEYTSNTTNQYAMMGDQLVVCSNSELQVFSRNGGLYVDQEIRMQNPILEITGGYGAAYDSGGKDLYVFNRQEILHTYSTEKDYDLISARVNEQGETVIVEQSSGYKASVSVYDVNFRKLVTENISSNFVTDAILSKGGKRVGIVTIGQKDSEFQSVLTLYNTEDGNAAGEVSLGSRIVLDMKWDDSGIWVQTECGLILVNNDCEIVGSFDDDSQYLQAFTLNADGMAVELMGKYKSGSIGQLLLVDETGEATLSKGVREQVLSLAAAGDYLGMLTPDTVTIYDKELNVYAAGESGGAKSLLLQPDGSAILLGSDTAWRFVP